MGANKSFGAKPEEKAEGQPPAKDRYAEDSEGEDGPEPVTQGTLTLHVIQANLERDVDMVGKQDPFVELSLPSQSWSWKSKVVESGGKTPAWNETVEIEVKSFGQKLEIKIRDEDLGGSSEAVCQAELDIAALCQASGFDGWVPCTYNDKAAGQI